MVTGEIDEDDGDPFERGFNEIFPGAVVDVGVVGDLR